MVANNSYSTLDCFSRQSRTTSWRASDISRTLCMKIQWDPYTGQFIDLGDDAGEIGVPSRTPSSSASSGPGEEPNKATGLKAEDLKGVGGSVGKVNAYIAQKLMESPIEESPVKVDALLQVRRRWPVCMRGRAGCLEALSQAHRPLLCPSSARKDGPCPWF